MRFIFIVLFLVSFGSVSMAFDKSEETAHLIRKITRSQSTRISNEIVKVGPCEANNQQLIHTCERAKQGPKDVKSISNKPITMSKIYYLGTFVKKLEQYENYPDK